MLRLTIYKNKACIYLVGGTEEPVITFRKKVTQIKMVVSVTMDT
nr:MAG TPA: hypothetical protein [Caudoviricetes sp.]